MAVVIPPVAITPAKLTSSTVPEEVAATYNGGTTYGAGALAGAASTYGLPQTVWRSKQAGNTGNAQTEGDWWTNAGIVYPVYNSGSSCNTGGIVTDLTNHDLYESLVDTNTGNALSDATKWKYIGKTNRYRLFDYTRNNKTSVPLTFTVVFAPGERVSSLAIAGIIGNSWSVSISSATGGGVVYTNSGSLNTRITLTWSDYFFGKFGTLKVLALFDLPPYSDAVITLTITSTSGEAALGACIVGTYVDIGRTEYTAMSDILNFSRVDRDTDGNAILTTKRNIPKTSQTIYSPKNQLDRVYELRQELNGVPAMWCALDDGLDGYFRTLSILGIYRQFAINAAFPDDAVVTLEVEEV
jgi:hypothetical protein